MRACTRSCSPTSEEIPSLLHREMQAVPARFEAPADASPSHWLMLAAARAAYKRSYGKYRAILKAMQEKWAGRKVDNKTLFDLFPGNPSKQAGMIAGLPESMRKGGY